MLKSIYAILILVFVGGLVFHFAALQAFNFLIPKDKGSSLRAHDVAYGPDARNTLDVYAPDTGSGPWPVVVFAHGGSWSTGNKNPYAFVGRALAAQGFVVLVINYRLHPQSPFPAFVEDAARAIAWASHNTAQFGGDESRIFAVGHSAGAYNMALAVLDPHYLSEQSMNRSALRGVVTLAGPFDFLPLDTKVTIETFGKVADLATTQPVNFANAGAPPFLILHGSADKTVFPRNAIALDQRLRAAGASSQLIIYEGVSHVGILLSLAKPLRSLAPALEDAVAFMRDKSR